MKITLKIDSKDLSKIISGLRKVIYDNERILHSSAVPTDTKFIAERNIDETEKLIKKIYNAHAAQTLQRTPKGEKK